MRIYKYKFLAVFFCWLDNIIVPIRIKLQGKHLSHGNSIVMSNHCNPWAINKGWFVYRRFVTYEMIDDLMNMKPFDYEAFEKEIEELTKK